MSHIAEASPVFNSNKYIGIDIKELPGGVEICSQNVQYSFVIPFPTASDTISFLGRDALHSQILKFNHHGLDIQTLTVSLMQTENRGKLEIRSSWSLMLEIISSDDYRS